MTPQGVFMLCSQGLFPAPLSTDGTLGNCFASFGLFSKERPVDEQYLSDAKKQH